MGKLVSKVVPHISQPRYKCGFSRSLTSIPRANFLYNAAVAPIDLITGNVFSNVTDQPIATSTPLGVGNKVWRGSVRIPEIASGNNHAVLCIFRLNATTDGVVVCGSGGIYGPQIRMVSGVLQYRPPATGTANVPATTSMTAGETYVVFGYSWGTASTDREIWINGRNVSGTKVNTGITTAIGRVAVGENPSAVATTPNADLVMAALWAGYRFTEAEAAWISSNPWSLFEPQRKFCVIRNSIPAFTANPFGGNFAKLLGGKL